MGIIHKKNNEGKEIDEILDNKNATIENPSFSQVKIIITNYLSVKEKIRKHKRDTIDYNQNDLFTSADHNHISNKKQLLRIRKWIYMIHSCQPFMRRQKKHVTCQNQTKLSLPSQALPSSVHAPSSHPLYVANNNIDTNNKYQHCHSNNSSNNDLSAGMNYIRPTSCGSDDDIEESRYLIEYNYNNSCYDNTYIEKGVFQFYKRNKSKFIKRVIKGPPKGFILACWIALNKIPIPRLEDVYEYYLHSEIDTTIKEMIVRDIDRTFPYSEYSQMSINYPDHLFNLLKAFANIDKQIGYCQGMNFIVAFLLILSEWNERDAFFLLIALFSNTFKDKPYSLRGFFIEGFPLLLYFNHLFSIAFEKHLPKLNSHFNSLGIPLDVWAGRWFQTLFTVILPIEWCIRLWNCLFVFSNTFMIKFAIVFIQQFESDLIELNDDQEVMKYFNNIQQFPLSFDSENLSHQCSIEKLINKADKLTLVFNRDQYVKDIQPDFDKILEEEVKIVYDLGADNLYIETQSIDDDNNHHHNEIINSKNKPCNTSLGRIAESNYENYNEEFEEGIDEDIDEGIDEGIDEVSLSIDTDNQGRIFNLSYKIEQNLRNHELDFRLLKSELDSQTQSFIKYNSVAITKNNNSNDIEQSINEPNTPGNLNNQKYFQTKTMHHYSYK